MTLETVRILNTKKSTGLTKIKRKASLTLLPSLERAGLKQNSQLETGNTTHETV